MKFLNRVNPDRFCRDCDLELLSYSMNNRGLLKFKLDLYIMINSEHLRDLEAEAIYIFREAATSLESRFYCFLAVRILLY